jgi:CDP-paratose 2-epimerase
MTGLVLITGGAGFVGTNLAARLVEEGARIRILDNLSRAGVERNLGWMRATLGEAVEFIRGDVRDRDAVARAVAGASAVLHLAAQVAVTTSLQDPIGDFEVNARGTLQVLEAVRALPDRPPLIFTSTNKVYGALDDVELALGGARCAPLDRHLRLHGLSEARPLDFHSPYGCSKGAADQYVLDYARTYRLPAVVLRMSCVYGPHQHGTEDQGWVAHFLIRALEGEPITLYGDGRQVRDVLHAEDLAEAFVQALRRMDRIAGKAFNIGGGPANTVSLLELVELIGQVQGRRPRIRFGAWRPADQRWYVSDTERFRAATGWVPRVDVRTGVRRLNDWLARARIASGDSIEAAAAAAAEAGAV